ncbi:hypothetical protein GCM10027436_24820 [Actinophytocola sediminis]
MVAAPSATAVVHWLMRRFASGRLSASVAGACNRTGSSACINSTTQTRDTQFSMGDTDGGDVVEVGGGEATSGGEHPARAMPTSTA